jgi:pteridine reductase
MSRTAKRVALVTGSGKRRLGSSVAQALAAHGHAIAVHYRSSAASAIETAGQLRKEWGADAAESFQADLTDENAVSGLIERVVERFGRIDVLVNCAAIWEEKSLEDVSAADVMRHFETNILGTFLCAQKAGLVMVKQAEGGSIVNLGDWALSRPYRNYAAYFASKGAIPTLTRALAVELGTRNPGVRVNAVLPGPVMLPPDLPEAERRAAIASTLVGREGRPEIVAQAVLYLVENDFVTGTCLTVDGGRTIFAQGS